MNTCHKCIIAVVFSTLFAGVGSWGQTLVHQLAELTASDGAQNFYFGNSLALSGTTAVAGSINTSISQAGQGAAYVFLKPLTGWANASQTTQLIASDASGIDAFGYSVAIGGNTIVVGAPRLGAVYVFVKPTSGWPVLTTQKAKIIAPYGAIGFGSSVGISGNTIVVGAPYSGPNDQGLAYLFVKPRGGWTNTFGSYTAQLSPSDLGATIDDNFGSSVSISLNTVVIGEPNGNNNAQPGAAYLFVKPASGWTDMSETAELRGSNSLPGDEFGFSVSVSANTVVVGSYCAPVTVGCGAGAAYVFVEPLTGWVTGTETAELTASDGADWNEFGESVSISGNALAIGAPAAVTGATKDRGAAYLYNKPLTGWATTSKFKAKLASSNGAPADSFGYSVAMSYGTLAAAAPSQTVGSVAEGAVYIFGH